MPKCCGCNGSGSCKTCVCTRQKRRCSNCTPSQHNRCCNIALPGSTPLTGHKPSPNLSNLSLSKPKKRTFLSSTSLSGSSSSSSPCPPSLATSTASEAVKSRDVAGAHAGAVGASRGETAGAENTENTCKTSENAARITVADLPEASNVATTIASGTKIAAARGAEVRNVGRSTIAAGEITGGEVASSDARTDAVGNTSSQQDLPEESLFSIGKLPDFEPPASANFQWGLLNGEEFAHAIQCDYSEIVHWRRNVFLVPSGKAGKQFIRQITSLFLAFAQGAALEFVAIQAVMVACALLCRHRTRHQSAATTSAPLNAGSVRGQTAT